MTRQELQKEIKELGKKQKALFDKLYIGQRDHLRADEFGEILNLGFEQGTAMERLEATLDQRDDE